MTNCSACCLYTCRMLDGHRFERPLQKEVSRGFMRHGWQAVKLLKMAAISQTAITSLQVIVNSQGKENNDSQCNYRIHSNAILSGGNRSTSCSHNSLPDVPCFLLALPLIWHPYRSHVNGKLHATPSHRSITNLMQPQKSNARNTKPSQKLCHIIA